MLLTSHLGRPKKGPEDKFRLNPVQVNANVHSDSVSWHRAGPFFSHLARSLHMRRQWAAPLLLCRLACM